MYILSDAFEIHLCFVNWFLHWLRGSFKIYLKKKKTFSGYSFHWKSHNFNKQLFSFLLFSFWFLLVWWQINHMGVSLQLLFFYCFVFVWGGLKSVKKRQLGTLKVVQLFNLSSFSWVSGPNVGKAYWEQQAFNHGCKNLYLCNQ